MVGIRRCGYELDQGLLRHLHQAHEPSADDLHEYELVESATTLTSAGTRSGSPATARRWANSPQAGHTTIWQFADMGGLPGDQNYLDGPTEQLTGLTQW
jgi:hypothetical protein